VPMAILNALILAVAMARPDESLAALNRLQQLRDAFGLDAASPALSSGPGRVPARHSPTEDGL